MSENILSADFTFENYGNDTIKLVESIKNYIFENDCPTLSMDVSRLNLIDASKVTIICSTYHWAKYPNGKISWLINSPEIKDLVKPLNLGNIQLVTVQ